MSRYLQRRHAFVPRSCRFRHDGTTLRSGPLGKIPHVEVIAPLDEAAVAATFLRAELQSPRFRDEIRAGRRGWRVGGLFDGLPDDIEWQRVALSPDEVLGIRYIDWDWWLTISAGTRSPVVAAHRIRAGLVPGATADADSERIARRLQSDDPPPELIAVATPSGPMVLVEGHVRLTSYALFPECLPPRLEVLLGISERVAEWSEY